MADLHIHSTLSPCGGLEMSPGRIVKEAKEKGIQVIAVTDHNACDNVVYAKRIGDKMGVQVIPGMELQTEEEVHLLAYFGSLDAALSFKDKVYSYLPDVKNDPDYFGDQVIVDENENVVGFEERLLLNSLSLSFDECVRMVKDYQGFPIPAHVDRASYGVINQLGFVPDYLGLEVVEVSRALTPERAVAHWPELGKYTIVSASDAHYPEDIGAVVTFFLMEEPSWEGFRQALKRGKEAVQVFHRSSNAFGSRQDVP